MAFTPEQLDLLKAAFDHVWSRMAQHHEETLLDSLRLAALAGLVARKGVMTVQEFEAAVKEFQDQVGAGMSVERTLRGQEAITEQEITSQILSGDKEAFQRRLAAEEEESGQGRGA